MLTVMVVTSLWKFMTNHIIFLLKFGVMSRKNTFKFNNLSLNQPFNPIFYEKCMSKVVNSKQKFAPY